MSKKRTAKSKYQSRYSPKGWVTPTQYIIELVCEQRAKFNQTDLPVCFWNLPEWQRFYKSQLRVCHHLLSIYDEKAIINAIKKCSIRTLFPSWIHSAIQKEQAVLDKNKKTIKENVKKDQMTTKLEAENKCIITKQRPDRYSSGMNTLLNVDKEI